MQLSGPVDVDPQEPGLAHRLLFAARRRSPGRGDEHLLPTRVVALGELEQSSEPAFLASTAAGQEVVVAAAGGDVKPAVAPAARCQLDQPAGVLVKHSELQRPVPHGRELAGEHPSVSEPDPAAQPFGLAACAIRWAGGGGCGHHVLRAQIWRWPARAPLAAVSRRGS